MERAGPRLRPALRWLHRWLGMSVGLVFAALALSGSLLLFQPLLFTWAHGDLIPDGLEQQPAAVDAWLANARAAAPGLAGPLIIWRPHVSHNISDAGMLIFAGREPGGLGNMGFAGVLVAPATGAVLGVIDIDRSPAYAPLFFHRELFAGETGRLVCGVVAIASLLALSIGLYLWWPPRRRLLRKLSPRPLRTTLSRAAPLHDWSGAWTVVALLVLAGTGLYLAQPHWVEPLLSATVGPEPADAPQNTEPCGAAIGLDAALAAAERLVPAGRWTATWPKDPAQRHWEIALRTGSDRNADFGDARVAVDTKCGGVALTETAETRPARETAEVWLIGLHDGSAFGLAGEIVVALLGLVPVVLAWTGVQMWLRGRRVARRTAALRAAAVSPPRAAPVPGRPRS